MQKINQDFELLDLTSSLMKKAVDTYNLQTHVRVVRNSNTDKMNSWLGFFLNGQEILYKGGVLLEFGKGRENRLGRNINYQAELLVSDKHGTKKHLQSHGFSVPQGHFFRRRNLEKALDLYESLTGALCVKPNNGRWGDCVTTALNNFLSYENAIKKVIDKYRTFLVEESVIGEHFRFFYVHPKIVGVRQGVPLSVVGDGISTVSELLEQKNLMRRHLDLPTHPEVAIDDSIVAYLAAQGLNPSSVPETDERVFLRSSAGYPAGADTILLDLSRIDSSYLDIVSRACQSVPGLHYCGVDIVIKDIYKPATDDNYWILELNANPALIAFYYPWAGEKVDVAGKIVQMLVERYPL